MLLEAERLAQEDPQGVERAFDQLYEQLLGEVDQGEAWKEEEEVEEVEEEGGYIDGTDVHPDEALRDARHPSHTWEAVDANGAGQAVELAPLTEPRIHEAQSKTEPDDHGGGDAETTRPLTRSKRSAPESDATSLSGRKFRQRGNSRRVSNHVLSSSREPSPDMDRAPLPASPRPSVERASSRYTGQGEDTLQSPCTSSDNEALYTPEEEPEGLESVEDATSMPLFTQGLGMDDYDASRPTQFERTGHRDTVEFREARSMTWVNRHRPRSVDQTKIEFYGHSPVNELWEREIDLLERGQASGPVTSVYLRRNRLRP